MPADLFDLAKRNIRIDNTCYACSHASDADEGLSPGVSRAMVDPSASTRPHKALAAAHGGGRHPTAAVYEIKDRVTPDALFQIHPIHLPGNVVLEGWGTPHTGRRAQYKLWNNTLHTDYSEAVLSRPPRERPISVIMALDAFSFFKRPSVLDGAADVLEFEVVTIQKGQAIAFTSAQLHAGGPNMMKVPVYRLFAYMVSNEADFPAGEVYPDTICRQAAASTALLSDKQLRHTTASGRPQRRVARY